MFNSTLCKGRSVVMTRDQLATVPTPEGTYWWKPVSHADLVESLRHEIENRGLVVDREEYAVNTKGLKLFGIMDLRGKFNVAPGTEGYSLGLRHANDKSMSIQIVTGRRVFVCDNMAFSGDGILLRHKHTRGAFLKELISRGLDRYFEQSEKLKAAFDHLKTIALDDQRAKAGITEAIYQGIVPQNLLPDVYNNYFNHPEYPDCAPRTMYGLHNAFTRSIKKLSPAPAFRATVELGHFFKI